MIARSGRGRRRRIQKLRENFYMVQVTLTETPSGGLEAAFLRNPAIAASGISAARGGNQRHLLAVSIRCRERGSKRSRGSIAGSIAPTRKRRPWADAWTKSGGGAGKSYRESKRSWRNSTPVGRSFRRICRFASRERARIMATTTKQDYYELLGVGAQGAQKEIRAGLSEAGPQVSS